MLGWILFIVFYVLCGELVRMLVRSAKYIPDEKSKKFWRDLSGKPRWAFWVAGGIGSLIAFISMMMK